LLRAGTGLADANFHPHQEDAIRHVVEGRGRLLVVQKTGWGKSFVYFVATRLLREAGRGPVLLVSPLLALMRNQIAAAQRMGVRAATINSNNTNDWADVKARLGRDEVDILLISPERLANDRFVSEVLAPNAARMSMLVVDEAHCISDWGHDFRPHYRLIGRIVASLPAHMRLLATTATANNRVLADLNDVLGPNLATLRGDLSRDSLTLQTIRLPGQAERLAWLAGQLATLAGHGIIYTLTVRDANQVAQWLRTRSFDVEAYTGQSGDRREELEQTLLDNRLKALVATTALGMGFDKPDLAFVIHYQTPGSVVAYYQQVGRAGRGLDSAYGVLLSGTEDTDITDWFIHSAFPTRDEVATVLEALKRAPDGLSTYELQAQLNISGGKVKKALDLMNLESPSPVAKQGGKWQLTAGQLDEAFWQRAERLTALRHEEQQQMQAYVDLAFGEHMSFLIRALDGDVAQISPPKLAPLADTVDDDLICAATKFLRRSSLPIEPRKQWPSGGMPKYNLRGNIKPEWQAEAGRALCVWGDAGWGNRVRLGKHRDGHFDDALVAACADMVQQWAPDPAPEWVTGVPSLRYPELVPDFAARLATALGLSCHVVLAKTDHRPEQKTMLNSIQQARNLDGAIAWNKQPMPRGPVLLIDDIVDSRWTLTVAAAALRSRGSGPVWPMVLAGSGNG
jgi:ATP-dependent DNA helicase RecQ